MWRLLLRLIRAELGDKRGRAALMILAIFAALTTYVVFGAVLNSAATQALQFWRSSMPYDIVVAGRVEGLRDSVLNCQGVVTVDVVQLCDVILGSRSVSLLALGESSLFALEWEAGREPVSADEIAIPAAWNLDVKVGDSISVLPLSQGAETRVFSISGILADKQGVPTQPLVSAEAMQSINAKISQRLLVALDGKVDIEVAEKNIAAISRQIQVSSSADQYAGVQQGTSMTDILLGSMRALVLVIAASAMGVLIYLTQREQAYQCGVLRAMGLRRVFLLVVPLIQGVVVFIIGSALSYVALTVWARFTDWLPDTVDVTELFVSQAKTFILFGLAVIFFSAWSFSEKPITELLRDVWGK